MVRISLGRSVSHSVGYSVVQSVVSLERLSPVGKSFCVDRAVSIGRSVSVGRSVFRSFVRPVVSFVLLVGRSVSSSFGRLRDRPIVLRVGRIKLRTVGRSINRCVARSVGVGSSVIGRSDD